MTARDTSPNPHVASRARELLARADVMVAHAADPGDRFEQLRGLYLGAVRGAGAALVVGEGGRRHRGSRSAWSRLPRSVPALAGWSTYFADVSRLRSEIEVGIVRDVSAAHVADVHTQVLDFLDAVQQVVDDYAEGAPHAAADRADSRSAGGSRLAG